MLCWTRAGAVPWPTTVQIRLAKNYGGIKAGAPLPSRQLSITEFSENVHYFRHTLDTPRSKACHSITLSALQQENAERLHSIKTILCDLQYTYIRAHIDQNSQHLLPFLDFAQHIALSIHHPNDWKSYNIKGVDPKRLRVSILLNNDTLPHITSLRTQIPSEIDFTLLYPFPLSPKLILSAPPIHKVQELISLLPPSIKIAGLPQCLSLRFGKKTSNRWYVDADHQKNSALLFFPDLLRYYKAESCRFCAQNAFCDGFFVDYLNETVQLRPLND